MADVGKTGTEWGAAQALQFLPEVVVLRPRLVERIWGVMELPAFLEQPQPAHPIGEAWLTALECEVEDAPGLTLGDIVRRWPEAFGAEGRAQFPLLMKLLFPREKLSVQVHPNDEEAKAIGESCGKTECWYILEAEPGAEVAVGFREPIAPDDMKRAIAEGTLESKLRYLQVKAGDMVYVDAGTIHGIGPGMVVLETQQYSDVTYRLYDYGRPRELHLDAGLAVTKAQTEAGLVMPEPHDGFVRLVRSPYFAVDRFDVVPGTASPLGVVDGVQILVALEEGAAIGLGAGRSTALPAGRAVLLLGRARATYALRAERPCNVIRVTEGRM
ncbi:MAG TPA: type I phosphomannose isomerase catalytic subunit [Acidobacteriaceae bacterium]|jgi:mannose-6-phosphate isomerase|nr:type I phosphomannose isomerase catalytic subunit [Acidobacteriaceae bacterium]